MQVLKTLGFCFVVAAGCAVVYSAQSTNPTIPVDYLVRSIDATDKSLESQAKVVTLGDWEYTARGRPVVCQFR